jgi:hypothetical protein
MRFLKALFKNTAIAFLFIGVPVAIFFGAFVFCNFGRNLGGDFGGAVGLVLYLVLIGGLAITIIQEGGVR